MRQIFLNSARARILSATSPVTSLPRLCAAARSYSVLRLPSVPANQRSTRSAAAAISRFYSADASPDSQPVVGPAEKHEFKAETKKLLHIVAHSLYSQREVFVRELISNASDALEKLRQLQTTSAKAGSDKPLEINITLDPEHKTITFLDSGIGMTADELKENLGTIARSGSKAFIEKMQSSAETSNAANSIVGQFGVGFYSAFMVGDKITVYTRSAKSGSEGYCWVSDGLGAYTLPKADNVAVGTKIVISVKEDAKEFLDKEKLSEIIKKYSNFVGFPITVDGDKVNTIEALWTKDKSAITEEDHKNFYRFISHSWDDPMYSLVYKADAPLSISSILYTPSKNPEALGFERIKPGVSLYSRKVLIMSNAEGLLPEWLRFVKGVVDSEDLPLNLSRELLQNGPIIMRLKSIISSRIIKWLQEEARKDSEKYSQFFNEFGIFLKEGVCQDMANQKDIAKLLRFETSAKDSCQMVSLDEYVEHMPKDQEHIYYFCTPNRKVGAESPYYVPFEKHGTEVLFMHHQLDEFVMSRLSEYNGKRLISVDSAEAGKVLKQWNDAAQTNTTDDANPPLTKEQTDELTSWMRDSMGTQAREVRVSERFMTYPAIVVDFDSPAIRRMMKMMSGNSGDELPVSPCTVEINPRDPVIKGLFALKSKNEDLARKIAQQLLDNAMIAAGIMDDPRSMVKRLNEILKATVS
ncbi:heat shock protein Hsp90-like protein [Coemansia reversa NRRL 1564]|uniref:Heat shock protein Hsp90-like protein n=1 Tax=Coemansia reversa (strain ATCC 12441 / NRRL 1564) TaxID=763665 RepID=A0A2G5BFR6_COERN|nr:heat shock protein Hsp90-like protein [Coemansia reversa NRRL 1564]|eukprot:PIA17822.1 heat shock protein Hsp90-like protein [Coemansia reversa NRRL 1564]